MKKPTDWNNLGPEMAEVLAEIIAEGPHAKWQNAPYPLRKKARALLSSIDAPIPATETERATDDALIATAIRGDGYECGDGDDRRVLGYMCRTGWDHEIGSADDGNKVYPSVGSLRDRCSCVAGCGIVAVELRFVCVVAKGDEP